MEKGTKKKLLIGAVLAVIAAFVAFGKKKLSPFEKMAKDVLDPNTTIGQAQRTYLRNTNQDPESSERLLTFVSYRQSHPDDIYSIAYNAKPSWGANEVVPI